MSEKINELLQDEAFAEAVVIAESEDAVKALFADKGVEISETEEQELAKAIAGIAAEQAKDGDELHEDALENVSGGLVSQVLVPKISGCFGPNGAVVKTPYQKWWEQTQFNQIKDNLHKA